MGKEVKTFYFAKTFSELTSYLKNTNTKEIFAGGTSSKWKDESNRINLPSKLLCIKKIPELCTIERHERNIDFGSCVTLAQLEQEGQNRLPPTLYDAVKTISNPFIKNLATIGGNICNSKNIKQSLYASLLALNTRLEFHSSTEKKKEIPIRDIDSITEDYVLTKIKVPYENWDTSIYKRIGPTEIINKDSASFVFLANTEKDTLNNLSFCFAGSITVFCYKNNIDNTLLNSLLGNHLPLPKKAIASFFEKAEKEFDIQVEKSKAKPNPILKKQYLNLLHYSLQQLS